MKPLVVLILLSMTALAATAETVQTTAQEPQVITSEDDKAPPLWVAAKRVAHPEGIVDLGLINSIGVRKDVEQQKRALGAQLNTAEPRSGTKPTVETIPRSQCRTEHAIEDHRGGYGTVSTLEELASHTKSIVRGSIRAVEPGFSYGTPASLLTVEVIEVVKGSSPPSPFYIDYLVARFRIGPYRFCNLNRGFEPRPGDEVLLFDNVGPLGREKAYYAPRLDQLFFERPDGGLFLPPRFRGTKGLESVGSLDDVVARLMSETESLSEPQDGAR